MVMSISCCVLITGEPTFLAPQYRKDFQGNLDDYIFKYMTPLRIHHWSLQDLNQDGLQEALVLIRIDEDIGLGRPNIDWLC